MSEKDINRWQDTITPRDKAPQPWTIKNGGSWDMLEVQPIPDDMLSDLARRYCGGGCPWNGRSLPMSPADREYMFLLYFSMQGLVARMRLAEKRASDMESAVDALCKEQMYEGGTKEGGVSVPFLMRMTLLRDASDLEVPQALVDEARAYFAAIDTATQTTIDTARQSTKGEGNGK
jgi:hypothetical protein